MSIASEIYSSKIYLIQIQPACLVLWKMAPVITMGRLSRCGKDPGQWKRCRNPVQTGLWLQIQGYGVECIHISYSYCLCMMPLSTDGLE